MTRIIVFDVNETLLDLQALDRHFERVFGDVSVKQKWFAQVLQSAMVASITGAYVGFGTVGSHALEMTAARQGVELSEADRTQILNGMLSLPPHPEVIESLERLQDAGLRLAALTNSAAEAAHTQLKNAGLIGYFDQVMSVEAVRRFKPDAEVYRLAASQFDVEIGRIRLVAAHEWDVTGAIRAGCAAAFIARPGMVLGPLSEKPDIIGQDLREVTDQILKVEL
jgi:2-haloacid dehalogenase